MNRNFTAYWDIDYIHKLSDTEATWLIQMLNEYYLGDKYPNPIIKDLRPSYKRRHRERNDMFLRSDTQTNETIDFLSRVINPEDQIIDLLDQHNRRKA